MELKEILLKSNINEVTDLLCKGVYRREGYISDKDLLEEQLALDRKFLVKLPNGSVVDSRQKNFDGNDIQFRGDRFEPSVFDILEDAHRENRAFDRDNEKKRLYAPLVDALSDYRHTDDFDFNDLIKFHNESVKEKNKKNKIKTGKNKIKTGRNKTTTSEDMELAYLEDGYRASKTLEDKLLDLIIRDKNPTRNNDISYPSPQKMLEDAVKFHEKSPEEILPGFSQKSDEEKEETYNKYWGGYIDPASGIPGYEGYKPPGMGSRGNDTMDRMSSISRTGEKIGRLARMVDESMELFPERRRNVRREFENTGDRIKRENMMSRDRERRMAAIAVGKDPNE